MREDLFEKFTEIAMQEFLKERLEDFTAEFESIKCDGINRSKRIKKDKDIFIRIYKLSMAISAIYDYCRLNTLLDHKQFKPLKDEIHLYMIPYLLAELPEIYQ